MAELFVELDHLDLLISRLHSIRSLGSEGGDFPPGDFGLQGSCRTLTEKVEAFENTWRSKRDRLNELLDGAIEGLVSARDQYVQLEMHLIDGLKSFCESGMTTAPR